MDNIKSKIKKIWKRLWKVQIQEAIQNFDVKDQIRNSLIKSIIDEDEWAKVEKREQKEKAKLAKIAKEFK